MDIRVFEKPPISGSLPEHHFDAQGDCTWIEFMLDDGATWAGVFGDGKIMKHQRAAGPFADGRTAFVIANGRGYVLDVPRHDLLYRTKIDYWATALSVPGRDFVIAAEFTRIAAIGRMRELWQSETIARDGIILDSSTFEELSGKVWWEDGWYATPRPSWQMGVNMTVSTSDAAKAVVRRNTEEVQGEGNFELFEELFADDFVDHTPQPGGTADKAGARNLYRRLRAAFPDFHAEIHWQRADGDVVTTYKTYHGTHQGEFLGIAPTGRRVRFETVDAMRVTNGRITEHWGVANLFSLMQQLGATFSIPPQASRVRT